MQALGGIMMDIRLPEERYNMLDRNHQLYKLAESIDWNALEKDIAPLLGGYHSAQWRLVSGAIYLKSFYDLSSTEVIEKWFECPYYRFFCSGEIPLETQKTFPIPQGVLDLLSRELAGEGYEAMIKALLVDTKPSADSSPTLH
jgi:IS5 family transposase